MIKILLFIVVLMSLLTGGDRTAKSLITAAINILILAGAIFVMYLGLNPLISGFLSSVLISAVTIFYQNEINAKTKASFISVMVVVTISSILIFLLVQMGHIQGFSLIGDEKFRDTNGYGSNIGINMIFVQVVVFIIVLMGAVIDAAVAITSGTYEIAKLNPNLSNHELFTSGTNIGQSILSSNVNTIFFVFAGEYMIMFVNYLSYYSLKTMINSKDFAQSTISITVTAIACVIIIPITSALAPRFFKKDLQDSE